MKLAQIITSLSTGGAENLVVETSLKFMEKGMSVDVISLKDNETPFLQKLKTRFRGNIIGLTKGSVYNPILIFKLIPILRKYNIVHIHLFPTLYWVVLAKWISFSNVKIIYTEHNTYNKRRDHFVLKYIDKLIYKGINLIITISQEVDLNLKEHLNYSHDFNLINNGVDIESIRNVIGYSKKEFFKDSQAIVIVQVSSFRAQKDQPTLIQAISLLPDNYKLLLAGDGELRAKCENLVKELDLEKRVKFLGIRSDIAEILHTSDIVVLSSNHEGLSLSSIEGMACKPFIASNVPGLREIVEGAGLLFEPGNSKELVHHIQNLSNDAAYYNQIAEQCKQRASAFDINTMVDKYMEVYKKVLNEN